MTEWTRRCQWKDWCHCHLLDFVLVVRSVHDCCIVVLVVEVEVDAPEHMKCWRLLVHQHPQLSLLWLHVSEVDLVGVCQYWWAVKYHCVLEKDINYEWSKQVVSMPTFSSHRKAGFQSTTREAVLFGCIWVSSLRMCHDDFTLPATMHKPLYLFPSQLTLLCNKGLKTPCCTSGSNLNQSTPGLRASQDSGHADWIQDVVVESLSIMRVIPAGAAFLTMMRSHDIWGWQGPANAVVGCWVWWLNFCQSIPRMTQHQTVTQGGLGQWLVNPMT